MQERLLLLTPPLIQTNCPYPATMHLTGYLRSAGFDVQQRDLSIKVVLDVLRKYSDDTVDEFLEILQNPRLPSDAKREAASVVEETALWIRDNVDGEFGLARYAEKISAQACGFTEVERLVKRRGVMDDPLEMRIEEAFEETKPTLVGVTCPFPGTLVGALKTARYVKRRWPGVKMVLGGGFVSTELREADDPRIRRYFDELVFDEGYRPMAELMGAEDIEVPPFVEPDYDGIDMSEYFDMPETENPMHSLWSSGKWLKLVMARGCYWHKCAFCDVKLPYIGCFEMPDAKTVVDAMESLARKNSAAGACGFHFTDEAMPPALLRGVSREIIRRGFRCEWWGNIRFDEAFTPALAELMAKAGCIAVTGGLECADDRLLRLMNKGITLAGARKAMKALAGAGIMVHAYLMYAFPGETEAEARGALGYIRDLFREGLVQSAFWHRFALTVHSPVAAHPEDFGIEIEDAPVRRGRIFRRNEIGYAERGQPDWDRIGKALNLALYNYLQGRGLDKSVSFWFSSLNGRKKYRVGKARPC